MDWMDEADKAFGVKTVTRGKVKNTEPANAPDSNLPLFDIKLKPGQDPEVVAKQLAEYGERKAKQSQGQTQDDSDWMSLADKAFQEGSIIEPMPGDAPKTKSKKKMHWRDAADMGAASGLLNTDMDFNTALEYLGNRVGSEGLVKLARENYEFTKNIAKKYEMPEDIQGDIIENPALLADPAWLVYTITKGGASLLPSLAWGFGFGSVISKVVKVLGKAYKWSPKVIKGLTALGSLLPASLVGGVQEGSSTYHEMLKEGATESQAARAMEAMTTASAALNAFSFDKMGIFNKAEKKILEQFVKKVLIGGGTETTTEWLEDPIEILIKHNLLDKGLTKEEAVAQLRSSFNVLPSAFVLGAAGTAAGNVSGIERSKSTPPPSTVQADQGEGGIGVVPIDVGEKSSPQARTNPPVENPMKTVVREAVEEKLASVKIPENARAGRKDAVTKQVTPKNEDLFGEGEIKQETLPPKDESKLTYDDNGNIIPLSERFNEGSPDIRYSRDARPEGIPLSREELYDYIGELTDGAKNIPAFTIVNRPSELPFDAPDDAKGAFFNGEAFLVAENITGPEDAREVITHETVGHFGLRGFFGPTLDTALLNIHESNPRIKEYAAQWRADNTDLRMTDTEYYYRSIEEAMAKMTEGNKSFTGAKRLAAAIQKLLRNIGLNKLANKLEAKTDAEAMDMLNKARLFIRKGMTKGKMPDALYPFFVTAWQGGPHDFNQEVLVESPDGQREYLVGTPDIMPKVPDGYKVIKEFPKGRHRSDKIGTGEGAQAYGYGHYFGSKRKVGEFYRNALTRDKFWTNEDPVVIAAAIFDTELKSSIFDDAITVGKLRTKYTKDEFIKAYNNGKIDNSEFSPTTWDKVEKAISKGHLYKVELAPAEDEYLLWDKPLSEQSEKVRKALAGNPYIQARHKDIESKAQIYTRPIEQIKDMSGATLYELLSSELGPTEQVGKYPVKNGSDKAASDYLHSLGIRGIKYLDGSSRGKGDGDYNYVIFDESDIEITAKFQRRSPVRRAYGRTLSEAHVLEEYAADLEGGVTSSYGVKLVDGLKKGEKVTTLAEVQEDIIQDTESYSTSNESIADAVSKVKRTVKNPKEFVYDLQDLGGKIFDGGKRDYFPWKKEMKSLLSDIWESVKPHINKVWDIVRNERGSFSWNKKSSDIKQAARAGKVAEVRKAIEELKKECMQYVEGSKLDESAIAYLHTGNFQDYIDRMPSLGNITPSEVYTSDEKNKSLFAVLYGKDGKIKPAILNSGYHVLQTFEKAITGFKDISRLDKMWTDPTRFIQSADQGYFGGAIQKAILWPIRSTVSARLHWSDKYKTEIMQIQNDHNLFGKKKLELAGQVVEAVELDAKTGEYKLDVVKVEKLLENTPDKEAHEIVNAAKKFRSMWMRLLNDQNAARGKRKDKKIPVRAFYRPHVVRTTFWSKIAGTKFSRERVMENFSTPDSSYPDKSFNPRAEERHKKMLDDQLEKNIVQLMADYVDVAGKDIFYTNIIQNTKIHTAVMRKHNLNKAADAIDLWVAESYAGVDPKLTKFRKDVLPDWAWNPILRIRRNLTRAVFPLNLKWNVFIQTSSAGLTAARYGIANNVGGLKFFTDPIFRDVINEIAYSKIIKERWVGSMSYQDVSTGGIAKIRKLEGTKIETVEHYMNFFTQAIEDGLTGHAIAAAYAHGKKLGLTGRALWEYASEGGAKTQSMYNPEDAVGWLRARETGTLAPFQTFAFEMFNSARELNLPGLNLVIGKTGAYETIAASSAQGKGLLGNRLKILALWFACALVTNAVTDDAIGRKPWELSSFIPFYGVINGLFLDEYNTRGLPTVAQYGRDLKKGVREFYTHGSFKGLRKWALRYHAIGGTQIERTLSGFEDVMQGAVHDLNGKELFKIEGTGEVLRALVAGTWGTEAGIEYWKAREEKEKKSLDWTEKKKRVEERRSGGSSKMKGLDGSGLKGLENSKLKGLE